MLPGGKRFRTAERYLHAVPWVGGQDVAQGTQLSGIRVQSERHDIAPVTVLGDSAPIVPDRSVRQTAIEREVQVAGLGRCCAAECCRAIQDLLLREAAIVMGLLSSCVP